MTGQIMVMMKNEYRCPKATVWKNQYKKF